MTDSEAAVEAGDVISVVVVTAVISVVVVTAETLTPAIGMLTEMTAGAVVVWTDEVVMTDVEVMTSVTEVTVESVTEGKGPGRHVISLGTDLFKGFLYGLNGLNLRGFFCCNINILFAFLSHFF